MTLRAVLLDAAGTLMDLRETVGETYARYALRHEVTLSPARLQDAFERFLAAAETAPKLESTLAAAAWAERAWWRGVVRGTFRAADGTARFRDFESFFTELYAYYGTGKAWALRPGVADGLAALRESGIRVGLVSNFDHRLPQILEDLEILELLDSVVLPSNSGVRKPEAGAFHTALARLEVAPDEAIYVGDDPRVDLDAARACGLRAVDVEKIGSWAELPARLRALATLDLPASG